MSKAYVLAHDDNEYLVFSSDEQIIAEQDDKEIRFKDSVDKVRVPIWSYKSFRIENGPENIQYFEDNDLTAQQKRVWRITLRYNFDVTHYDFEKKPSMRIEQMPLSLILVDEERDWSLQIFIQSSLYTIECGWVIT